MHTTKTVRGKRLLDGGRQDKSLQTVHFKGILSGFRYASFVRNCFGDTPLYLRNRREK